MMSLLEALAAHPKPVNLKLLAEQTRLHPSTAHRILNVMVRNRMVDRIEPGTYCLGARLHELGTLVRTRNGDRSEPPDQRGPSWGQVLQSYIRVIVRPRFPFEHRLPGHRAAAACSRNPSAFTTLSTVENSGLPFRESAL